MKPRETIHTVVFLKINIIISYNFGANAELREKHKYKDGNFVPKAKWSKYATNQAYSFWSLKEICNLLKWKHDKQRKKEKHFIFQKIILGSFDYEIL